VNYIHTKGVEANRLSYIGYGELRPAFTNETREGREKNRRVEFRIIDGNDLGDDISTTSNMR